MSRGTRWRDYQDYHRPLATYSEKERNRILESKHNGGRGSNYIRSSGVRFSTFSTGGRLNGLPKGVSGVDLSNSPAESLLFYIPAFNFGSEASKLFMWGLHRGKDT
jgi:hypothetical protein